MQISQTLKQKMISHASKNLEWLIGTGKSSLSTSGVYPSPIIDLVDVHDSRRIAISSTHDEFQAELRGATGQYKGSIRKQIAEIIDEAAAKIGYELKPVIFKGNNFISGFRIAEENETPQSVYWVFNPITYWETHPIPTKNHQPEN